MRKCKTRSVINYIHSTKLISFRIQLSLFPNSLFRDGTDTDISITHVRYRSLTPRVLDFVASMVAFINVVSMALMAASTLAWSSATEGTRIDIAVAFLQLLVLLGEACPTRRSSRKVLFYNNAIFR